MEPFPYIVDAKEYDENWILQNKSTIDEWLNRYGAILFRNYPLSSKQDFAGFSKHLIDSKAFLDYTGGTSPRENMGNNVYSSTKMPFFLKIPLHSEMAYRQKFPGKILFFCETPPLLGGETPIVDTRLVYQEIPELLRSKIQKDGIIYYRHLKNYTNTRKFFSRFNPMIETGTWQFVFSTNDRAVVENYCRENKFLCKWQNDGSVILETHLPATLELKEGKSWLNSFHFFQVHPRIWGTFMSMVYKFFMLLAGAKDLSATTGQGKRLSDSEISALVDSYERHVKSFRWQKGDLLYLDNTKTAHGRNPYLGFRKILVMLAEEKSFPLN